MRSLVLATVSALALGVAGLGPVYAQGNTGTATPAPAAPSATAPTAPATPGSMSSGKEYGTSPYMANTSPSGSTRMTRSDVREAQQKLHEEGLYHGKIDGIAGPKMRQAIRSYQHENGLPVTAKLDRNTLSELGGGGAGATMGQGSSMPPSGAANMTPPASPPASSAAGDNGNTGGTTGTSYK